MAFQHFDLRAPRALRPATAAALTLLLLSCSEAPTGTDRPGFGSVAVHPTFSASARFAPITLDRVQVVAVRVTIDTVNESSTRDTLANTTRNFSATAEELRLSVPVPISGSSETLEVSLSLYASTQLLFTGTSNVLVTVGQATDAPEIPVDYVGPGSNAVGLIIEPFDTTVTAGSTTPFRATAINGQEQDVGPFYMRWSLNDNAPTGASIDAAGRLKAPTTSGTLWVRGNLPNGVADSTQVTVTGTPGQITIVSGDHQTAQTGSTLELPLVVRVTTGAGAPVAGATVQWGAPVGGGGYDGSRTTVTDANGESQNTPFLGQNPGVNHFTATVAGAGTVTFLANEDQTGSTVSWIGNVSAVWSDAANWAGGKVPGVLDSVIIGGSGEFTPVLDTTPIIGAMTLNGNGRIELADHGLVVVRNLTVLGSAVLFMTSPNDIVTVGGDAVFDGADTRGAMTAGALSINGNFTQRATNSGSSFYASGEHTVSLAGTNPTISFATPGLANNQSAFNQVLWGGVGQMTLSSNFFTRNVFFAGFQGSTTITSSNNRKIQAAQLLTGGQSPLIFNNVSLTLQDTVSADFFISQVRFQNMPTNVTQLEVNYLGGIVSLNSFTFSTAPVAPNGFYISATDTRVGDGSSLSVQVQNPTPASMGNFFQEGGDAEIIWPYNPP